MHTDRSLLTILLVQTFVKIEDFHYTWENNFKKNEM